MSNSWVQPDPCGLGWVELDLCNELDWVKFFFTHHSELGQKNLFNLTMHAQKNNYDRMGWRGVIGPHEIKAQIKKQCDTVKPIHP